MSTTEKPIDPSARWQPSAEERALLEALQDEAAKEKSVADFARRFLPWGRSQFDQIMDSLDPKRTGQSYFDKITDAARQDKLDELRNILEEIPRKRLQYSRITETKIVVTDKIRALETAVREAAAKPGPERIILVLGPTGAGKTIMCNYLSDRHSARIVEVRDSWRRSETGYVPLLDICRAVGLRVKAGAGVSRMEDDLVRFCGDRHIVLCFDEAEFFGRAALNKVKFLLNKTRIGIVLFAVPGEYERWFDLFSNEAEQIARRTHSIIETSILNEKDIAAFFPENQFAAPASLALIAREASAFGHYSLVNRIAARLANVTRAEESDVRKALESAKRQMRRDVSGRK